MADAQPFAQFTGDNQQREYRIADRDGVGVVHERNGIGQATPAG